MFETIQVRLGDGRVVEVEAARYQQLQQTFMHGGLGAHLTQEDGRLWANDSQEAMAFVVSQLAYTETQVYERQYTPLQYRELVPITNEAGEYADSIRFETMDYVGNGKRQAGQGQDIPLVDVQYGEVNLPVVNGAVGYKYSTEELRRSAFLRRPVTTTKPAAAMDSYERHMNKVALMGESTAGLFGLFNNPDVPVSNAPNGQWSTANQANTSAAIQDVNTLINAQWAATAYNDTIDTIVMAPSRLAYISSTPRSANSDTTILEYILKNNVAKTLRGVDIKITQGYGLENAGVGGTARMLGYVNRIDRLVMHIPMAVRFLAPQLRGLDVYVPGEYKYSGVKWRYAMSALYQDNI